jgi:hypothetical protein
MRGERAEFARAAGVEEEVERWPELAADVSGIGTEDADGCFIKTVSSVRVLDQQVLGC